MDVSDVASAAQRAPSSDETGPLGTVSCMINHELLASMLGMLPVRYILMFRATCKTGNNVVEGNAMVPLWKTAYRLVFKERYKGLPADDSRRWFRCFLETVHQLSGRRHRASAVVPTTQRFVRQSPNIMVRTFARQHGHLPGVRAHPEYWLIKCYDGDAVIDVKKRIQKKLLIPIQEQVLSIQRVAVDEFGEQVLVSHAFADMQQVTSELVPDCGILDLECMSTPHLAMGAGVDEDLSRSNGCSDGEASPSAPRTSLLGLCCSLIGHSFFLVRAWQRRLRRSIRHSLERFVRAVSRWFSYVCGIGAAQAMDKVGLSPASYGCSPYGGLASVSSASLRWLSDEELREGWEG